MHTEVWEPMTESTGSSTAPTDISLSLLAAMLICVDCSHPELGAWLSFTEHRAFLNSQILFRISTVFLPERDYSVNHFLVNVFQIDLDKSTGPLKFFALLSDRVLRVFSWPIIVFLKSHCGTKWVLYSLIFYINNEHKRCKNKPGLQKQASSQIMRWPQICCPLKKKWTISV